MRQLTDGEREILAEIERDCQPTEEELRAWEQDDAFYRTMEWEEDVADCYDQAMRMATY